MSLDFARSPSLSAVLAVASLIATTSVGVAGPAALVESVLTHSGSAEVMSYVETGKTFRLGPQDTMVLSYLEPCLRETITGGTVTIGIDHSEVQGGKVTRTKLDCRSDLYVLTGNSTADFPDALFGASPRGSRLVERPACAERHLRGVLSSLASQPIPAHRTGRADFQLTSSSNFSNAPICPQS